MWSILTFVMFYNFDNDRDNPRFLVKLSDGVGGIHKFAGVIELDDYGTTLSFYVRDNYRNRVEVGAFPASDQVWQRDMKSIDVSKFADELHRITSDDWEDFLAVAEVVTSPQPYGVK